jgi:hypothetical protein
MVMLADPEIDTEAEPDPEADPAAAYPFSFTQSWNIYNLPAQFRSA